MKVTNMTVYNNLYAKPALGGQHQKYSMTVVFSVDDVLYYGQFCYESQTWDTIPGDEKIRQFIDRDVQYWFYPPFSKDIFERYREDVLAGRCSDAVCRLEEYNLERRNLSEQN